MPSVLNADALTTLANLRSALRIVTADTSNDTYLEQAINRSSGLLEEMTNRKFNEGLSGGLKARKYNGGAGTHSVTGVADEDYVYFSGSTTARGGDTMRDEWGRGVFHLPAFPVQADSVVPFQLAVLNSRSSAAGVIWDTTSLVENDAFILDRPRGIIRLIAAPFVWGNRNYRVTMAAGYQYGSAQPYIPPDLESACIELAKGIFRDNRGVTSESIGSWSRSFDRSKEDPVVSVAVGKYSRISL